MIFGSGKSNDKELQQKLEQLEKENRIMRAALEFYADTKHWEKGHKYRDEDNATIFTDGSESGATVDKGSKAYRALQACKSS